jgi:pimeloyl-ACP methyl ester carboxylesterase
MTITTTTRVRLCTGIEMHYREQGEGPEPVLLLHGWPDSGYAYDPLVAALPVGRYRSLAVDQRGFGSSDRPAGGYGIDDLAADAVAFLDALGLPAVTVVGHSMGSLVARRVAQVAPARVRALVLIGTALHGGNAVVREVVGQIRDLPDPVPDDFIREFADETVHLPLPEPFLDGLVAESRKAPARVWRAVLDGIVDYDDADRLAGITAPTLVIGGEQDALYSVEEQAAAAAAIPGARLELYPDTGHCPNWERPDRVAADLARFVDAA